jgi:hypothetical protein
MQNARPDPNDNSKTQDLTRMTIHKTQDLTRITIQPSKDHKPK